MIIDAVREVGEELWEWSRNVLGDLEKRIKRAKKELEECRRRPINAQNVAVKRFSCISWRNLKDKKSCTDAKERKRTG